MGGYQLMISADILRGRYRESLENPNAIASNNAFAIQVCFAYCKSCFFAGPSHHGPNSVELVSVL